MGREDEGSDLWEWETPRGLFLSSQKVPADVLVEVLVEMLVDFRNTSLTVPGSPIRTSNLRTPSPFLLIVE